MRFLVSIFIAFFAFEILNAETFGNFKSCNESLGWCVPAGRCSSKTVFHYGSKLTFNTRIHLEDDETQSECHYLEKCCDPENIITEEESKSTIVRTLNEESVDQCIQKCRTVEDESPKLPPKFPSGPTENLSGRIQIAPTSETCGFRNKRGIGLELTQKTDVAQFGEFPWQIALSENVNSAFTYICGGSLIHPSVVVTGAHCVVGKNPGAIRARAGEWDTQTVREPLEHEDRTVSRAIVHPDFGPRNLTFDIALLIFETPFELSPHINTICLPPQGHHFDGQMCIASGWGASSFEQRGAYRVNLKKIELPTIQKRDCQNRLRTTKLGDRFKLHMSFLCAGGEKDIDACIGDGGGPLVCPIKGETGFFYQAGIVSWGIECGKEGVPGVYADVSKFRKWVDDQMTDLGFGSKSYTF